MELSVGSTTLNTMLLQLKDSTVPEIEMPMTDRVNCDPANVQFAVNGSVGGVHDVAPSDEVNVPLPKTNKSSFSQGSDIAYSSTTGA